MTAGCGVLLGNGDGTFQPAVTYSSGGYGPSSLAIVDVNRDGIVDVLVNNVDLCGAQQNGCVAVLLGNGDGSFRSPTTYDSGGPNSYSMAIADFNSDGKVDIVVTDCSPYNGTACGLFGVLLGNGDGTFNPVVTYNSGGVGAWAVTVGDVNRDGKVDLVIGNLCQNANCTNDGVVSVLLGKGDGTFQAPVTYPSGGRTLTSVVADVNRDGKPDIVVTNGVGKNGIAVLLGNGDGTFQPAVIYNVGQKFTSNFGLVVTDMNGDRKLDVVVADCSAGQYTCQTTGSVGILLGIGDGTFRPAATYSSGGQISNVAAVADLNGDGLPDVIVTNCAAEHGNCGTDAGVVSVLLAAPR